MEASPTTTPLAGLFPTKLRQTDTVLWGRSMSELGLIAAGWLLAFPLHDTVAWLPGPLPNMVLVLTAAAGPLAIVVRPDGRRLDQWCGSALHYRRVRGAYVWRRQPLVTPPVLHNEDAWAARPPGLHWTDGVLQQEGA